MTSWLSKDSKESKAQSHSDDQDLSTILTVDQRGDLTLLIATICEGMRRSLILDTFDATKISTSSHKSLIGGDKNLNIDDSKPKTAEEKEEEEKAAKLRAQREKELSAPKQQQLKDAALDHLQKWQNDVIIRVGEAVNAKKETLPSTSEAKEVEKAPSIVTENKKIGMSTSVASSQDADRL